MSRKKVVVPEVMKSPPMGETEWVVTLKEDPTCSIVVVAKLAFDAWILASPQMIGGDGLPPPFSAVVCELKEDREKRIEVENVQKEQPKSIALIYVAGAFTAPTAWGIEQNCRKAEEVSLQVWKVPGCAGIAPHLNTRHFFGTLDEDVVIHAMLVLLERCDAIFLIPGWENSKGTFRKIEHAKKLGIPVFKQLDELRAWAKSR